MHEKNDQFLRLRKIPYLSEQLIAYIGNKRALLPFLAGVFCSLTGESSAATFLDPFCGSGSVSRLARYLGFSTYANDWEYYAEIVTRCHVTVRHRDIGSLFLNRGGVEEVFRRLNAEGCSNETPGYISRHFAPENTDTADYRKERLFYTRENALFIDRVREIIEEWYPGTSLFETEQMEKTVLLSSLLYEAATHANTSGVFKAHHKGFGGHGKDALVRIMRSMHLEIPLLIDRDAECRVYRQDAAAFAAGHSARICYLDPPYNAHQYGSNYFMLNTIALWDKPPVSDKRGPDGRYAEKAGIRKDWVKTRSDFCRVESVKEAFSGLMDSIDADHIVLSYNTEGVLPFEEMCGILEQHGRLELFFQDYVTYRGGKQSISRRTHNLEFLIHVRRGSKVRPADREEIEKFFLIRRIGNLMKGSFSPERLTLEFTMEDNRVLLFRDGEKEIYTDLRFPFQFRQGPDRTSLERLSKEVLLEIEHKLHRARCVDRKEESEILISLLRTNAAMKTRTQLQNLLLRSVKKFTFRKYRMEYLSILEELEVLIEENPELYAGLTMGLERIKEIADLRFNG